jgi:hypothetical protein
MSNMRQIGIAMLTYADYNNGYLFPPDKGWTTDPTTQPATIAGTNPPQFDVWPWYVFDPHVWNPKIMFCPSDLDPVADHSYTANSVLLAHSMSTRATVSAPTDIRYSTTLPPGHTPEDVIVLAEKVTSVDNYYFSITDWSYKLELYRHGLSVGSNYLMLDMHVEPLVLDTDNASFYIDPWENTPSTQPTTPPPGSE